MERFIQQNCNNHPSQQICLLRFHKDVNQVMSCASCIEEQNELSGICYINLLNFMNSDEQTLFANWPPFFKEYLQKSKQNVQQILPNRDKQAEVESLFKELKENLIQKINEIQKAYQQIIIDCDEINDKILDEYNQISGKQKIKEILHDNQLSIELKNQKLKIIYDEVLSKTQNTQKLINIIEDNQSQYKILNLTELQKILHEILDDQLMNISNQKLRSNQILTQNFNIQNEIPGFHLIGSDYKQSKQLFSINQNTLIASTDFISNQIQAYSNIILEANKQYEILVELIQNDNRKIMAFGFGLIQDDCLLMNYYDKKLMYHSQQNKYGISQIKKGENLSDFEISKNINQFKFKICIKDNILEVSDFPKQEHIIEYDNNLKIDQSKNYRFCINLPYSYKKGDWIKATVINKSN